MNNEHDDYIDILRPFTWSWDGEVDTVIDKDKLEKEKAIKFKTRYNTILVIAMNGTIRDRLNRRKCPYPVFLLGELAEMKKLCSSDIANVLEFKTRFGATITSVK